MSKSDKVSINLGLLLKKSAHYERADTTPKKVNQLPLPHEKGAINVQ